MMICLPHLSSSLDDDRLTRDHVGNTVGVEEVDYVVHVPLRILSPYPPTCAVEFLSHHAWASYHAGCAAAEITQLGTTPLFEAA
jgi:hypothetical protein